MSEKLRPQTIERLKILLNDAGIDLSRWGQADAKSVEDLWVEIDSGEVTLSFYPLVRRVRIVTVNIQRGSLRLVEIAQHFHDGRTRSRGLPPSEKFKPGEFLPDAAIRCLSEELNVLASNIMLDLSSHRLIEKRKDSFSYPNLESHYEQHLIDADVPDLPTTDFLIQNNALDGSDPVAAHLWGWRPITPIL